MLQNKMFICLFPLMIMGCYSSSQNIDMEKNESIKSISPHKVNKTEYGINMLRFEVNKSSVLSSARYWGVLKIKNNCLILDSGKDGEWALVFPLDKSKKTNNVFWNNDLKALSFEGEVFKLGQDLDLGGGPINPSYILGDKHNCVEGDRALLIHSISLAK